MPCSDSSSGLNIKLDSEERLLSFEFAKITCSSEIKGETGYSQFCQGKSLDEILTHSFSSLVQELGAKDNEEKQFILHLEWEALRSGIAQYLGIEREDIDDRCRITSVEHTEHGVEIAEVILPPKELPKIIACGAAKNSIEETAQ